MSRFIDNEDYAGVLARLTQDSAVLDRLDVNREDFDFVADQLLGGGEKDKIDIADLSTIIQEIEALP